MTTRTTYRVLGAWVALVAAMVALGVAEGVPLTLGLSVLVLAGVVPPAIVYSLSGRQDTQTVAEMLRK